MVITRANSSDAPVNYPYQTVGAVYKTIHPATMEDMYICRVISRKRFSGEFVVHDFHNSGCIITADVSSVKSLSYIKFFESYIDEKSKMPIVTLNVSNSKPPSMFPAIIKHEDPEVISSTGKGSAKGKAAKERIYSLEGIILCLNDSQQEGIVGGNGVHFSQKMLNSMSRLEPVVDCCATRLYAREMHILENVNEWLSDEIINAAVLRFLEIGIQYHVIFAERGTVLPPCMFQAILDTLLTDPAQSRTKRDFQKADEAKFPEHYEMSKALWEYVNIFSQKRWYFSIINYPQQSHWMFIAIHSGTKFYYIYDPQFKKGYIESVKKVLHLYIDAEAAAFATSPQDANALTHQHWKTTEQTSSTQRQQDSYNCGLLALIAFFRATVAIQKTATTTSEATQKIVAAWKCDVTPTAVKKYRQQLKDLLTAEDLEGFAYFHDSLPGYINSGGAKF